MNAPQPPLPDIDWTEAVEAAHVAIFSALLDNGLVPTAAKHIADLVDAAALHAAWPILHAAAQPVSALPADLGPLIRERYRLQ